MVDVGDATSVLEALEVVAVVVEVVALALDLSTLVFADERPFRRLLVVVLVPTPLLVDVGDLGEDTPVGVVGELEDLLDAILSLSSSLEAAMASLSRPLGDRLKLGFCPANGEAGMCSGCTALSGTW